MRSGRNDRPLSPVPVVPSDPNPARISPRHPRAHYTQPPTAPRVRGEYSGAPNAPRCVWGFHDLSVLGDRGDNVLNPRTAGARSCPAISRIGPGQRSITGKFPLTLLRKVSDFIGGEYQSRRGSPSLHRHTLSQIPRLVHIRPPRTSRVIRQQLQGHHVQYR